MENPSEGIAKSDGQPVAQAAQAPFDSLLVQGSAILDRRRQEEVDHGRIGRDGGVNHRVFRPVGWQFFVANLLIMMLVLVVHESGHSLGMKLMGYRDIRMFFIPFLARPRRGSTRGPRGQSGSW